MSRNPATDAVVSGEGGPVWSVAVPGVLRGDMARVELVGGRAFVDVTTAANLSGVERVVVELSLVELRALLGVVAQWPGMVRE